MFDAKKDKRAAKNAPNACRGRWSQCGGRNVNVNDVSWHICNDCSIKRAVAMAKGEIRPGVRAVAVETPKRAKRTPKVATSDATATTVSV